MLSIPGQMRRAIREPDPPRSIQHIDRLGDCWRGEFAVMWNTTVIVRWLGRPAGSAVLALAVLGAAVHPAAADVQLPPCVGGWTASITSAPWLYGVAAVAANDVWAVGET